MRCEGPAKALRGRRKESSAATFFQFRLHISPEFTTAVLDLWADSSDDALISHTVLQSASALIAQVQQDRHASVVFSRRLDLTQDSLDFAISRTKRMMSEIPSVLPARIMLRPCLSGCGESITTTVTSRFGEWHRARCRASRARMGTQPSPRTRSPSAAQEEVGTVLDIASGPHSDPRRQ
jgi:hypothetical protein